MSINRYDEYKEAEADSLGRLPKHWNYSLLKRWITVKSGDMISSDEETESGTPIIGGNGIRSYTNKSNTPGNTLVIGRVGAKCGCVHHIQEPFWASEHALRVVEKKSINKRYLFHLLSSLDLNQFAIKTAQPLLNTEIVETQWIFNPPLSEQTQIARFLDRETAKIDALIAEQQRLIELLQVKRQAVISHAVTKGLNPNAPMKDSGVEWLGEVPEHWEVKPLKYLANIQTGMAKGKDLEGVETADIPYLRVANVQDGYLDLDEVHLLPVPIESISRYLLRTGDVLMNEGGDFDKLGRGCIWSGEIEPCVHQNHVFAVRPHSISGEWLNAYTTSKAANSYFIGRSKQSTNLASISSTNLMGLSVPVPPSGEATEILGYMNARVQEIDDLKLSATQAVDLLQERRSALISAAVTGQIDVRGLVPEAAEQ